MPLKQILSSFMGTKPPKSRGNPDDQLDIVKAAAWAWYQHGSGSERKPESELFNITRRSQGVPNHYQPSRYKVEAMKIKEEDDILEGSSSGSPMLQTDDHHDNSDLLDSYEIESISNKLDQVLVECRDSKLYDDDDDESSKGAGSSGGGVLKKKKTQKVKRGFWARHGVVCGTSREDVVHTRRVAFGECRQRPPMVKMTTRRPRVSHS